MEFFLSIFALASIFLDGAAVTAAPVAEPSAPPRQCEFQLSTWCISEGSYEVNRKLASDSIHDRIWTLRGRFNPKSHLIILEPNGCKQGFSDVLELIDFGQKVQRENSSWERMLVKLKENGTCNLEVLFPVDAGDPMEWASSSGLGLIKACEDKDCKGRTLLDLKPKGLRKQ